MDEDDDDIQIIKEERIKKPLKWVSSSFGDFGFPSSTPNFKKNIPAQSSKSNSKVQQVKKSLSEPPKTQQTISSSFCQDQAARKRQREPFHKLNQQIQAQPKACLESAFNSELWSDVHRPVTRYDLAVHKKKIDEISDWFLSHSDKIKKLSAPILLLTGPPGAGKTACVEVLCHEKGFSLQQWENKSSQLNDQWGSDNFHTSERSKVDVYASQSQSSQFLRFLLRANKYSPLDMISSTSQSSSAGKKNIIVVEELPNAFLRDAMQLHEILRNYHHTGNCPLLFIVTESNSNSSCIQKLFPKDLQQELKIQHISVNPVAPTMLIKCLQRVTGIEAKKGVSTPESSVVETIAMASGGDIRAALNTLQFACRKDTVDLKSLNPSTLKTKMKRQGSSLKEKKKALFSKTSKDSNSSEANPALAIGVKDASVFLFHAIGKILYFKRGKPEEFPDHPKLPKHLCNMERHPLLLNPEEIAEKVHLSGDFFTSFLQENYVEFLPSIEDLDRAAQYFSDAEYTSSQWLGREELQNYSVSIATRGYIHSNSSVIHHDSVRQNQGWRPLHKSQLFNTSKQAAQNIISARQLFKGFHWEPEVLCTELLPYISLTNPTLHDTSQINFIQDMTQFSQTFPASRTKKERLDERDIFNEDEPLDEKGKKGRELHSLLEKSEVKVDSLYKNEDDDDDNVTSSQQQIQGVVDHEDDFVIEEYDD